jgi:ribosomal protein S18 acetylase RimI-like enzyme
VDRAALLDAGDRNLVATLSHFARTSPDAVWEHEGGLLLFSLSRTWPGPYHNGVVRIDPEVASDALLGRARAFFDGRAPGFCVWIAGHADLDLERHAVAAGYVAVAEPGTPRMALTGRLGAASAPPGVTLHEVEDEAGRREFLDVTIDAYAESFLPPDAAEAMLGSLATLRGPGARAVVARAGARPVAAAMTVVDGDTASIQSVGTVFGARRRGLAELCTRWAVEAAFDLGARVVVLEASEAGEPLYRRMGFVEVSRYRWCFGPPQAPRGQGPRQGGR